MNNSEFIKFLQDSVGDGEKVSRVLAISNIQEIKNFLISLGVKPELTELAGFVELTRSSLSTILLNNNAQISEKEISYGENQKVYVDEKGILHLSDNKTLEEQPNGYVHYYENGSILFEKHVINEYGAVIYSSTSGNPPFSGEYTIIERRMGDNLPTVYVESTDGASYGISDTSIDFGPTTNPTTKHTEFQDNYYTYCKHYPKLKEWYASRFPMKDKDEFACTDVLNNAQCALEIDKLEKDILALGTTSINKSVYFSELEIQQIFVDMYNFMNAFYNGGDVSNYYDENGKLKREIKKLAPTGNKRMGANPNTNGGLLLEELKTPDFTKYGVKVVVVQADVSAEANNEEVVANVVKKAIDAFGRIDVLINNAQASASGVTIEKHTTEQFNLAMYSGIYAVFYYMKACYPYLKETKDFINGMEIHPESNSIFAVKINSDVDNIIPIHGILSIGVRLKT